MRLVFGLGNPGTQYSGTRHNVGFDVVRCLADRYQVTSHKTKFQAEYSEVMIGSEKTLLISPLTFMNRSGESVVQFVKFFKPDSTEIVVISDDLNLEPGRIRWKPSGSAGGQNGLKDIIQRLGNQDFPRLRVGIGRPRGRGDVTSWVLGRFLPDELEDVKASIDRAADSIEAWCDKPFEQVMSKFNCSVSSKDSDK
ncbi:MAG: aminoacyl-tRNA hydrolase [Fuerstiella sp.]